ncbi:hypothetical protein [Amycolatopsis sp. H20-H5]|uniref:hypothetical protein n=1 Tax=Amycolatopsis sp. H20-H5 TaxID=3046309 RepID=UPI002DB9FB07|nr:hypothetical protein [Amycolatopsis sp. H20-H5]MEC3976561.1 hypothetical protein [Amycolatopsis sp. H20-H5]
MRSTTARRAGLGGVVLMLGLGLTAPPAQAETAAGVASLGSANFTRTGQNTTSIETQGGCSLSGPASSSADPVTGNGITFGGGTSTCTTTVVDAANHVTTTKSEATGKDFDLSALVGRGGKRIRLKSYTVSCAATQTQTSASWTFGGMSGLTAPPSPTPANYVQPITRPDGTVVANAMFNEQIIPGDGSVALNLLHLRFLPPSGMTGDVVIGATACSPTP